MSLEDTFKSWGSPPGDTEKQKMENAETAIKKVVKANVRDRSEIHDGAAILKVVIDQEKRLEGEYWTSRKTTGDLSVKFISRKLAESIN